MDEIKNIFANRTWSAINFPQVRANDVVDMLVIAYLIYKVLLWVKETRAWSLIKGLVIILFVYIVSIVFEMRTASWIIVNSLNVGLVAVLVLFQPELRKLLIEIGEGKINRFFSVPSQKDLTLRNRSVFEIMRAAEYMSSRHTGALMAIENDVSLSDIENMGIPMDALCSAQLLINIFEDKTPLHDGAVIIRNDRIAAATCIFPLTEREIGRELGTRHRAAVGMSEASDADIVVVSEETGAISIAANGELFRNLSNDEIKRLLLKEDASAKIRQFSLRRRS